MVPYYGDFAEDDTVDIPFNTFTSDDPSASSTITNFVNTDVHIHKDGGVTQRNNAAGITVSVDFDGITGNHLVKIDTSDDTVAAFWVTGSEYQVRIEGTTIDGATINAWIGAFSIERAGGVLALLKAGTVDVNTKTITNGIIVAATLGADCITNAKIADNAIAVENIKDAAITAAKLAADCITNAKIADNTIAVENIKDAALTAAKFASDCITAAKIADAAIDNATFAADVGSTAYASNIIALAARKVLDELNLDHWMKVTCGADDVVNNTALAKLVSKDATADWSDFTNTDESLEALKDGILATIATDAARLTAVRAAVLTDWINGGRLDLLLDAIPTTAMRGTDNAATAAKLLAYIRLLARSDAAVETDAATELTAINADEGAGAGNYSSQTEAQEAIRDRGDAVHILEGAYMVAAASAGTIEVTYTMYEDEDGENDPIEGVEIFISTDSVGSNAIWSGTTDANGVLREAGGSKPWLDAGTYYMWRKKSGFSFDNPDTEVVS